MVKCSILVLVSKLLLPINIGKKSYSTSSLQAPVCLKSEYYLDSILFSLLFLNIKKDYLYLSNLFSN